MSKQNVVTALLDMPLAELYQEALDVGWEFGFRFDPDGIVFTFKQSQPAPPIPRQSTIDDSPGGAPGKAVPI